MHLFKVLSQNVLISSANVFFTTKTYIGENKKSDSCLATHENSRSFIWRLLCHTIQPGDSSHPFVVRYKIRDVPIPKFEPIPVPIPILNFKAKPIPILNRYRYLDFSVLKLYIRRSILTVTQHEQATPKQLANSKLNKLIILVINCRFKTYELLILVL